MTMYRFTDHILEQTHVIEAPRWDVNEALRLAFIECRLAWSIPDNEVGEMAEIHSILKVGRDRWQVMSHYEGNSQIYTLQRFT